MTHFRLMVENEPLGMMMTNSSYFLLALSSFLHASFSLASSVFIYINVILHLKFLVEERIIYLKITTNNFLRLSRLVLANSLRMLHVCVDSISSSSGLLESILSELLV